MATAQIDTVIRHLRRAVLRQDGAGWTDGQLLACFIEQKDEAAFEALVHRHGPMVFGVCRRVVRNHHDAEDAFQATFLVLARKASSVKPRERVANWLHGVALRTAMKAKAMTAKRRGREKQVTEMPEPEAVQQDQWRDLQFLLDQELNGLPENYRLPILFCDLEGKTIKAAAQQLGWPQGTLAGRLARGRKLLAKRLANRGVVLSGGSLAAILSQNAASAGVPTSLMSSTVKAATMIAAGQAAVAWVVPVKVAARMEGVLKAMLMNKLKAAFVIVLMLGFVTTGATVFTCRTAAQDNKPPMAAEKKDNEPPIVAEKKDAPLKSDMSLFRGTWRLISITTPNKVHFPHECKWTFKDDKIQMTEGFGIGEPVVGPQENAYHVGMDKDDPPSAPNGFNLTVGDEKKFTFRGIFAWDGSRLKLCFPLGRQVVRPTEIPASGAGGNNVVLVLEHEDNDERTHQPKANADNKAAAQSEGPQKNGTKHDAPKTDLDRLQGVWSVVSIEQGGKPSKLEKAVFMVDGKRACWQTSDFEMQGGLYLDPTSKPKTYDLAMSTKTMEGIYSLEGDTLRLCYDMGTESKRQGRFITEKGSQQVLFVLKRTHGPEVFPCILPDGTRAFPTVIEKKATTPPPIEATTPLPIERAKTPPPQTAPQPKESKPKYDK